VFQHWSTHNAYSTYIISQQISYLYQRGRFVQCLCLVRSSYHWNSQTVLYKVRTQINNKEWTIEWSKILKATMVILQLLSVVNNETLWSDVLKKLVKHDCFPRNEQIQSTRKQYHLIQVSDSSSEQCTPLVSHGNLSFAFNEQHNNKYCEVSVSDRSWSTLGFHHTYLNEHFNRIAFLHALVYVLNNIREELNSYFGLILDGIQSNSDWFKTS
jgi:hypothetical protein